MYLFLCSFMFRFVCNRDCLTLFRRAKQRRCRSGAGHPASHFWGNKRSFVATKVQLAWKILQRRAMSSRVLFCAKITVERGFRTKCTTLLCIGTYQFDRSIGNVQLPGMFDKIYLSLCVPGHLASCCPKCGMELTLVSDTGCRCAFHLRTIGNIIRSSANNREKKNTDIWFSS